MTDQRNPDAATPRLFTLFRMMALVEGVTTLLLFLIAMPIKYILGDPSWVSVTGTLHGYAWVAYMGLMFVALRGPGWGPRDWWRCTFAALFPFGTFLNDAYLRRRGREVLAA
ncbi:MAG: DUF3817 domain-containing protein [Rhodobacteraceae bacterium]|nr:DUF3817 domain-containing protein [Paracoccaceae bacterium]